MSPTGPVPHRARRRAAAALRRASRRGRASRRSCRSSATTLEVEPESTFTLVYGNRTPESTMFRAELDALAGDRLTVHHVLSRDAGRGPGRPDHARRWSTRSSLARSTPGSCAGPQELVDELAATRTGTVLTEVFHTEPTHADVGIDVESQVTVALDGVESTFAAALVRRHDPRRRAAAGARAAVLLRRRRLRHLPRQGPARPGRHGPEPRPRRRRDRHRLRAHLPGAPGERRSPARLRRLSPTSVTSARVHVVPRSARLAAQVTDLDGPHTAWRGHETCGAGATSAG